jgi:hypothetical protein
MRSEHSGGRPPRRFGLEPATEELEMVSTTRSDIVVSAGNRNGPPTAKNWTQEDLAGECGLDRSYVSGLEVGRRNPTYLNLL